MYHPEALLKRLKLRNSILLGYLVLILFSGLTACIVYFQGVRQVERQSQQVDLLNTHINEVKNLAFSIVAMEKAARGYLIGQKMDELETYEIWDSQFYQQSETIRALIEDPQQRETLNEIIDVGDRMNELYRRLISYVQLDRAGKSAIMWQQGEVQNITDNLSDLVETFEAYEQAQLEQQKIEQAAALQLLTFLVFGIAILSGAIALITGSVIATAISRHLTQETKAIAQSSAEIATTSEEQDRNSAHQAAAVSEATITLDELNTSFRHAEAQATHSAEDASQALELSQQGTAAVQRTLERMALLHESVTAIQAQSERLRDKSVAIETITQVVGELAAQTNLLALNAAVEAVHAGEQGKGFAIVAREIRRLADESQASTLQINQLIGEIRQAITATANATTLGTKTVSEGVAISQEMAKAFGGVATAVQNVVSNNQQLSLNAKQQVTAMEQMVTAMNDINQAAQSNAAGVSQVRGGVEQLYGALENLKALI
ncbi:MAG: chemotaxis protein [Spirulina sp. DLM2.Bin59]|nr:MAG: chemotaxis protein [Spirulina sp. DLM2.Bin59]